MLTLAEALAGCARGLGVALVQQSLEGLVLTKAYAADGCFRLADLERAQQRGFEPGGLWLKSVLKLGEGGYVALHALRLFCGVGLVCFGHTAWALPALLASVLLFARQRDHFNGGSDAMTSVLLLSLSVACYPRLRAAAVAYIAVQATFSYVVAGLAKLRNPDWRSGLALAHFAELPRYAVPLGAQRLLRASAKQPWLSGVGVALPLIECSFPCVYFGGTVTQVVLSLSLLFHLGVAWFLGLNRFWPAWLATYPAVLYFARG